MDILCSVIVPIYRVEKYLRQCVDSIINQTYQNLEIILVDDGSDDNCPFICDEYAKRDKRIKVIHKVNGGQDSARKEGIMAATGKYVGYVDGDDWIEPEMYERLIYFAEEYKVKVVESGIIDTSGDYTFIRFSKFEEGVYKGNDFEEIIEPYILYGGSFFEFGLTSNLWNKIYERKLLTKYQMYPEKSENLTDDLMCALPCITEAKSIYITHKAFYHYRVRHDSCKYTKRTDIVKIIKRCYPDWLNRFSAARDESHMERQIQYLIMYLLLMKAIYVFDDPQKKEILVPFGGIDIKSQLVLYGAGATGIYIYDYLVNKKKMDVIWADKNYVNLRNELPVVSPETIGEIEYDYVLIAVLWESKVNDIKKDLIKLGVPEKKVLWIREEYIEDPVKLLGKAERKE